MPSAIVATLLLVSITLSLGAGMYLYLGDLCFFNGSCIPPICELMSDKERLGIDANGTILYKPIMRPINKYDTKCMSDKVEERTIIVEVKGRK